MLEIRKKGEGYEVHIPELKVEPPKRKSEVELLGESLLEQKDNPLAEWIIHRARPGTPLSVGRTVFELEKEGYLTISRKETKEGVLFEVKPTEKLMKEFEADLWKGAYERALAGEENVLAEFGKGVVSGLTFGFSTFNF